MAHEDVWSDFGPDPYDSRHERGAGTRALLGAVLVGPILQLALIGLAWATIKLLLLVPFVVLVVPVLLVPLLVITSIAAVLAAAGAITEAPSEPTPFRRAATRIGGLLVIGWVAALCTAGLRTTW